MKVEKILETEIILNSYYEYNKEKSVLIPKYNSSCMITIMMNMITILEVNDINCIPLDDYFIKIIC